MKPKQKVHLFKNQRRVTVHIGADCSGSCAPDVCQSLACKLIPKADFRTSLIIRRGSLKLKTFGVIEHYHIGFESILHACYVRLTSPRRGSANR